MGKKVTSLSPSARAVIVDAAFRAADSIVERFLTRSNLETDKEMILALDGPLDYEVREAFRVWQRDRMEKEWVVFYNSCRNSTEFRIKNHTPNKEKENANG